jgi:hypothetical protein
VTVNDGNTSANFTYNLVVAAYSLCDVYQTGTINVADVQSFVNQALGASAVTNDLDGDGTVNVLDVQIAINAAMSGTCMAQ